MRSFDLALPRFLASALAACALAACSSGGDLDASSDDALHRTLAPQSLQHGTVRAGSSLVFDFAGEVGDAVVPDVWPTGGTGSPLLPTLQLFGPPDASGTRPLLASGTPASDGPAHLSLQLDLPQSGSYQLAVGGQGASAGRFSLRMWSSASRTPRPEAMQVSLLLAPTAPVEAALDVHASGGARDGVAWSANEIDAIVALIRSETDLIGALSDCTLLYSTMEYAHQQGLAADALVEKAEQIGAERVGDPATFARMPTSVQSFALYWLGVVQPAVFRPTEESTTRPQLAAPLARVAERISALVASWSGAVEVASARKVTSFTRGGALYGYAADWQAVQLDTDGVTQVFSWSSTDFFGAAGGWLGESSLGALEPDDGD